MINIVYYVLTSVHDFVSLCITVSHVEPFFFKVVQYLWCVYFLCYDQGCDLKRKKEEKKEKNRTNSIEMRHVNI